MLQKKKKPDLSGVFMGAHGFLIGRVIILQFVSPLAIAFTAGYLGQGLRFYVTALLTLIGTVSVMNRIYIIKYIIAFVVLAVVNFLVKPQKSVAKAITATAAVLVGGLAFAAFRGMSIYFAVTALVEGLFTFGAAVVLQKCVLPDLRRPRVLTTEEQISFAILAIAVVIGTVGIHISGLSLGWVLLSAFLMIAAHKLGLAAAAASAMFAGFALVLSGYADYTAVLGIAAATAGAFRRNKPTIAAGFMAGLGLSILYTGSLPSIEMFGAAVAGAAVFLLIPQNFYFDLNTPVCDDNEYLVRAKTILSQRLYGFSYSFERLSRTFSTLAKPKTEFDKNDTGRLIDDIAGQACHSCGLRAFCWESHFYDTYRDVLSLLSACEQKNRVEITDIPISFRKSCINLTWFTEVTNRLLEIYRINMAWQNRMVESRELVSEQLAGVSRLIQSLASELDLFMNFKPGLEDSIREELNKNGIEVLQVIVLENKLGKYEVSIRPKTCPGRNNCIKELSRIAGRVLGRRLRAEDRQCTYNKGCSMRLVEEQRLRISSGAACRPRTGSPVSGDNYSFMQLKNGQCMLALSDGMGSGEKAREESAAAVELLEDFIESGFEKDMAVKMINSVLVLKSDEDSFSTMDICSVDLHTGYAEFIKIGAAATYLLRDGEVQSIKSSSLPIGMLNTVDLEVSSKTLKENDIIVMVTDGIADAGGRDDGWISQALCGFGGRNPQDIADFLMLEAEKLCAGVFRDDMTVLAARIWERA